MTIGQLLRGAGDATPECCAPTPFLNELLNYKREQHYEISDQKNR